MSELVITIILIALLVIGIFIAGWVLGGEHKESKIEIGALTHVNAHYQKMAADIAKVDEVVDGVKSLLEPNGVHEANHEPESTAAGSSGVDPKNAARD